MIHTTKTKTTVIYNDFDIFKTKFKVCNVQLGQATNIQLSFVLETKIPKKLDTFSKKYISIWILKRTMLIFFRQVIFSDILIQLIKEKQRMINKCQKLESIFNEKS